MPTLSKFETCPTDVLNEVVLSLVNLSFLGPPVGLLNILLTSKTLSNALSRNNNPHLYARIFDLKFDVDAAVRRLGDTCKHTNVLADELVKRCAALNRLRCGVYPRSTEAQSGDDGFLVADLWKAYMMFLESDGKNAKQLIHYAKVGSLVEDFIKAGGRFHDGAADNGSWTIINVVNALSVTLFWLTDEVRVKSETAEEREAILCALIFIYAGSFKYPSSHAPDALFLISPKMPPPPSIPNLPFSLASSPLTPPCLIPQHFGSDVILALPLLTQAALLSCVVRLEIGSPHASSARIPDTRAEAAAIGHTGLTVEDYEEQKQFRTFFVDWDEDGVCSQSHDHDWIRLSSCFNPWSNLPSPPRGRVFTPGMLDGLWVGKWITLQPDYFASILNLAPNDVNPLVTNVFPFISVTFMQFRIREHHQRKLSDVVDFDDMSCDGKGEGVFNAWLPKGTTVDHEKGEPHINIPGSQKPFNYITYDPISAAQATVDQEIHADGIYGAGVWDVILTAQTNEPFGTKWGPQEYYGRVRAWDGLIVLVRKHTGDEGRWIFRGYVHGDQNLIGRWRETGTSIGLPGLEGVWSMTKRGD